MHTLKAACTIGIAACLERGYHHEGMAGIGLIVLLLAINEVRKRVKTR